MAGFAVFMTLIIDGFLGLVIAGILSAVLVALAKRKVPASVEGRRGFLIATGTAPFLGVFWVAIALILHVTISGTFAHQDSGLSADPYVTFPNGYKLESANTHDGSIVAPGFETDVPVHGPGYVRSIIDLQWTNPYFLGSQFDFEASDVRYFLYDTRDRTFRSFRTNEELLEQAASLHIQYQPASYWDLYAKNKQHWPSIVFVMLLILGEAILALWLWRYSKRIRRLSTR